MMTRHRSVARLFRWPAIIALLVMFGLISALLGDGLWDAASWVALVVPLLVISISLLRAGYRSNKKRAQGRHVRNFDPNGRAASVPEKN